MTKRFVKAKESSYRWGYKKGDILEITDEGENGCFLASNLSSPGYGKRSYAIICESEFKDLTKRKQSLSAKYYLVFVGIWAGLAVWNLFEGNWRVGILEVLIALLNLELYTEKAVDDE